MKVLIAVDKFKGSLTAQQASEAIRDGILIKYPGAQFELVPMADGGEGTSELLAMHTSGRMINIKVTGPLFEPVNAQYGLSGDGSTAFIESAKASGLQLLPPAGRNPLFTTTAGTGELIRDALQNGVKTIVLGIGGTATNDAGIGMASSLGFQFVDGNNNLLKAIGGNLGKLGSISDENANPGIAGTKFIALCDVDNPLYGETGAAHVYGPQKGADPKAVELLDDGLKNFERVVRTSLHKEADFRGAGAGGGLASGAKVFLNASIRRGMDYVMEVTALEQKIKTADLVITGEGKIDTQTLAGKVVGTVAAAARKFDRKVIAACGVCELREIETQKMGISAVVSLVDPFTTVEEAMRNASHVLKVRMAAIV
jgi:glycerate kinase